MLKLKLLWEAALLLLLYLEGALVQFAVASPLTSMLDTSQTKIPARYTNVDGALASFRRDQTLHQRRLHYARNRILFPLDGSVNQLPIRFRCALEVDDSDEFYRRHGDQLMCVEIDHKWTQCTAVMQTPPVYTALPTGNHSAVAFLVDADDTSSSKDKARLLESERIRFTVLLDGEYREYVEQRKRDEREQFAIEEDQDLVTWASSQPGAKPILEQEVKADGEIVLPQVFNTSGSIDNTRLDNTNQDKQQPLTLVIGVKTSVLHGFPFRQAIRNTWASETLQVNQGVKVYFVGCQPVVTKEYHHGKSREALIRAIEMEKQVYDDFLTDELECEDSYLTLPIKVKEFFHFAVTTHPQVPYVMIADDDIYLRVDELAEALRKHGPRHEFYAGQVWAKQFLSPVVPIRHFSHKNYLPESQYPMDTVIPFVFGPHYVMSMDCAEFIAENRKELGDLASLDDVSVAFWLLTMQVHPEHIPSFQNLRDTTCSEGLVSFADLSSHAIRVIHANLQRQKPFCRDFDIATWLKADQTTAVAKPEARQQVNVTVRVNVSAELLVQVVTEVSWDDSHGVSSKRAFAFSSSKDSFTDHCSAIAEYLSANQGYQIPQSQVLEKVHTAMTKALEQLDAEQRVNAAYLELWRHNLWFALASTHPEPRTITIVYSHKGSYNRLLLECLFAAIYQQKNPIRVIDEATFQAQQRSQERISSPDVFVFSILDGGFNCTSAWELPCQQVAAKYVQTYGNMSSLIVIAGEPWGIRGLDESVLLVSTVSQVLSRKKKHVYLPMASMAFGEGLNKSPMLLLQPRASSKTHSASSHKFCAYMYARCDRPQREYMYDLLNAMEPVDALGVCQGSAKKEVFERWWSRIRPSVFQDAIDIYAQYKFVIAFENAQRPGYVTEKLVNAFLAGSIPIYLGHSDTVSQLFNPKSFIDCGRFATLRECALRVMEVHRSVELYESMLREPVVGNETLFHELFSWHPDVPSSFLASQIANFLQNNRPLQ